MIIGIGNDIVEIERIRKAVSKEGFLERYFTQAEIELFKKRHMNVSTIAGNFSGKEAVSKVFGTGIVGFGLKDIEILRNDLGKPVINLYNEANELAETLGIASLHITISHSKDLVNVVVVGEGHDRI